MPRWREQSVAVGVMAKLMLVAIGASIILVLLGSGKAHADTLPPNEVDDANNSEAATCDVLGKGLNGNVHNDSIALSQVAQAISRWYGVSSYDAGRIEGYQVSTYCPWLQSDLVSAAEYTVSTNSD